MFDMKFASALIVCVVVTLILAALVAIGFVLNSNPVVIEVGQPTPVYGFNADSSRAWFLEVPAVYAAADSNAVRSIIEGRVKQWQEGDQLFRLANGAPRVQFRTVAPDTVGKLYFRLDEI